MPSSGQSRLTRYLFHRVEVTRTTWLFRFVLLTAVTLTVWLTGGWWTESLARSLVCDTTRQPADALVVENFDSEYFVFARARELQRAGYAARVFVPIGVNRDGYTPNDVALATADAVARIVHLNDFTVTPIREVEPVSLNAAADVRSLLKREGIKSVIVVTPLLRSRRSAMVYARTLAPAGITMFCEPVEGVVGVSDWTHTWHGIQNVAEQWLKLQYYRLYVLPFLADA